MVAPTLVHPTVPLSSTPVGKAEPKMAVNTGVEDPKTWLPYTETSRVGGDAGSPGAVELAPDEVDDVDDGGPVVVGVVAPLGLVVEGLLGEDPGAPAWLLVGF